MVCPVFRVDGRESITARGRMHLLSTSLADTPSAIFENLFSQCLLCGACEQVCPRNLPITDIISKARSRFSLFYGKGGLQKVAARSALARPGLLEGLVKAGVSLKRIKALPTHSGLRLKLGLLEERPSGAAPGFAIKESSQATGISYFTGCLAGHLQPSVATAPCKLLSRCGYSTNIPEEQCCCGVASWSAGKRDQARALAKKNITAFATTTDLIITSCASCSSHLYTYPDLFAKDDPWHQKAQDFADRVQEFTEFFGKALLPPKTIPANPLRVFYHDPCHLRFTKNGQTAPRNLLTKMGLQIVEPENGSSCCGQGGLFHLGYPELSNTIFQKTADQALAGQPDCVTTSCSGCLMQYQEGLGRQEEDTRVVHLSVLLNELFTAEK